MRDTSKKQKEIPLVHHMRRTGLSLKVRPGVVKRPAAVVAAGRSGSA
jgi:hypothetical protein